MSVATPIPLLQNLPDVNVTPAVGVDEYALVRDNDTARFVLRAPFAGILATGATVGATSQAQAFTNGVVASKTQTDTPFLALVLQNKDTSERINSTVYVDFATGNVNTPRARLLAGGEADWDGFKGYLSLLTQNSSGNLAEAIHIDSAQRVGINDAVPAEKLDVTGNINVTGVYKVDDVQVLSNRVIDARCADVANSGDATTDGLIDALRDAMIAHGLIAAA